MICGVDEAGRGPLAGPVFAAAVLLDPARPIAGLADSKILSEKRRIALAESIRTRSLAWAVAFATVEEIDRLNILRATLLAMRRAVERLSLTPTEVLVDGLHRPDVALPVRAIIGGDATVAAISAAPILAETRRRRDVRALQPLFPKYGFDRHKGYPTPGHLDALGRYGVCEIHRRSFAPVRKILFGVA